MNECQDNLCASLIQARNLLIKIGTLISFIRVRGAQFRRAEACGGRIDFGDDGVLPHRRHEGVVQSTAHGANADDTRPVGLVNSAQEPSRQPSATLAPYLSMRFQNLCIRDNKRL